MEDERKKGLAALTVWLKRLHLKLFGQPLSHACAKQLAEYLCDGSITTPARIQDNALSTWLEAKVWELWDCQHTNDKGEAVYEGGNDNYRSH